MPAEVVDVNLLPRLLDQGRWATRGQQIPDVSYDHQRIEGSDLSIEIRKEPLDPARVSVRMVERMGEKGPVRTWAFERDGKAFLSMRTTKAPRAFHDDTGDGESFALALCRAVGWAVPATFS